MDKQQLDALEALHRAATRHGEMVAREALREAAESLSAISRLAGIDEYMLDQSEVRAYAASRAKVANTALDQATYDG